MQRLDEHYPETPVPLDHSDPFTLLIAVLLSAQCTDKKVNGHTGSTQQGRPQRRWPDYPRRPSSIHPPGLAETKAKHVKRLAERCLSARGRVPESFKALEALPGVGHKTASVVMSQAFDVPVFPWTRTFTDWPSAGG